MERTPPQRQNSERSERYLIVEVGCGATPYTTAVSAEYKERIFEDENVYYVGVDLDEEDLVRSKQITDRSKFRGETFANRMLFVKANGADLPFGNETVAELVLRNVLGDPDIGGHSKLDMLTEAARVLKIGGVLRIIEQYTPQVALRSLLGRRIKEMQNTGEFELIDNAGLLSHEINTDTKMLTEGISDKELSFVFRLKKIASTAR